MGVPKFFPKFSPPVDGCPEVPAVDGCPEVPEVPPKFSPKFSEVSL